VSPRARPRPAPDAGGRDVVFVRGLEVRAVVGVEAWERRAPRPLVVDVEAPCDAARAAASDEVRDAVDYDALARAVAAYAARVRPRLVETMAEGLAADLLRRFRLPWVRLRVAKPGAVPFAREVGVAIERVARP
jgi:dihydroneopterin aldolase